MIKINDYQNRFAALIEAAYEEEKATIALLGWAFKKNTNDSRESGAISWPLNY